MYTLDTLLAEIVANRGPLLKKSNSDDVGISGYRKAWDAFNRYVTSSMEKRQTLNVHNFCKIGWKVEEQSRQGKRPRLRPHFQLADNFLMNYAVDAKAHPSENDKCLTSIEEFNFSKAAIRFSQSLTKENLFMGLRAIFQHMGEVVAKGMMVSVDFEVGQLIAQDREVRFNFAADLYLNEGVSVPEGALQGTNYKPSVSFAAPSKDALTLRLDGNMRPDGAVKVDALGGWEDHRAAVTFSDQVHTSTMGGHDADLEGMGSTGISMTSSAISKLDRVQQAALGRHIKEIEHDAATAVNDKQQWEVHLKRCVEEEQKDLEWRRALNKDHSEQLRYQMQQAQERRQVGREHMVEQASCHGFPSFVEAPEAGFIEYVRHRRNNLKDDLDQQVQAKENAKQALKERDRMLEACHIDASKRELATIKQQAAMKQQAHHAVLTQAWQGEKQIREVKKAIKEHHKAPSTRSDELAIKMSGLSGTQNSQRGSSGPGLSMTLPASQGAYSAGPSPRSADSAPSGSQSARRPPTGSVRRMPIGAAASLALQREKLNSSRR